MTDDHCCELMRHALGTDDIPVFYEPRFRLYDLQQHDGLGSRWQINYCPWCGRALPHLSEQWLEEVKRRGLDPGAPEQDLPSDLLDDRWWKSLGL